MLHPVSEPRRKKRKERKKKKKKGKEDETIISTTGQGGKEKRGRSRLDNPNAGKAGKDLLCAWRGIPALPWTGANRKARQIKKQQ